MTRCDGGVHWTSYWAREAGGGAGRRGGEGGEVADVRFLLAPEMRGLPTALVRSASMDSRQNFQDGDKSQGARREGKTEPIVGHTGRGEPKH